MDLWVPAHNRHVTPLTDTHTCMPTADGYGSLVHGTQKRSPQVDQSGLLTHAIHVRGPFTAGGVANLARSSRLLRCWAVGTTYQVLWFTAQQRGSLLVHNNSTCCMCVVVKSDQPALGAVMAFSSCLWCHQQHCQQVHGTPSVCITHASAAWKEALTLKGGAQHPGWRVCACTCRGVCSCACTGW